MNAQPVPTQAPVAPLQADAWRDHGEALRHELNVLSALATAAREALGDAPNTDQPRIEQGRCLVVAIAERLQALPLWARAADRAAVNTNHMRQAETLADVALEVDALSESARDALGDAPNTAHRRLEQGRRIVSVLQARAHELAATAEDFDADLERDDDAASGEQVEASPVGSQRPFTPSRTPGVLPLAPGDLESV